MIRSMLALFFLLGLATSCQNDLDKISTAEWNPELAIPFINTDISFLEIIESDSNFMVDPDGKVRVIYSKDSLFEISATDVYKITEQTGLSEEISLGLLKISDDRREVEVTIESLLDFVDEQARDSLIEYQGQQAVFPPLSLNMEYNSDTVLFEEFVSVDISSGFLVISILNNLPVVMEQLTMEVQNGAQTEPLLGFSFSDIEPGESASDSVNLDHTSINNEFMASLTEFKTESSFPDSVLIDFQDRVLIGLETSALEIAGGVVRISEQKQITDSREFEFDVENMARIGHLILKSGELDYTVNSGLPLNSSAILTLSSASQYGNPPQKYFELDAGSSQDGSWDLTDAEFDMTFDPQHPYNKIKVDYEFLVLPSQELVEFDSADNVNFQLQPQNFNFSFVDGYLGKYEYAIPQETVELDIDFFEKLDGSLTLSDPEIILPYYNSVGIPALATLDLIGTAKDGRTRELNPNDFSFLAPDQPGQVRNGQVSINKNNSDIVYFLEILPDLFEFGGTALANPGGQQYNFVYDTSRVRVGLEIDLPLRLSTNGLYYSDTVNVNFEESGNQIESGKFYFAVKNDMPLQLDLEFVFLDQQSGEPVHTITLGAINAAEVNSSGKVIVPIKTLLEEEFGKNTFESIRKADRVILFAGLKSSESGSIPVTLYTNYIISIRVGLEVRVKL